jgi:hypothetical protein
MAETSSDGSNRSGARAASSATAPARPRPALPRKQERRRGLIPSACVLLVGGAIAVVVLATMSPKSVTATNPTPVTAAIPERDLRTARITTNSDGNGCSQQIFDNQSGRMFRSQKPCDTTEYDASGVPVPAGTIHRLDAISKSFPGH